MSELLKKSKENFSAAALLIDSGIYAPSVHCSYYSCFQKLKHVIAAAYNCSYDDLKLENERLNSGSRKRIGSHEFMIDFKLVNLIRRNKSDYDNIPIVKEVAELVKTKSERIYNQLNSLV